MRNTYRQRQKCCDYNIELTHIVNDKIHDVYDKNIEELPFPKRKGS